MSPSDPRDAFFDVTDMTRDLGAQTGRSATTVLLFAGAKIIVALGSTAVLARLVPPQQQGIVALAMPAILIATGLSEFGLGQAIVQRKHVTHRLASTLLWTSMTLGVVLALLVALLGIPAARFYGTPEVTAIFAGLAPYIFLSVITAIYVSVLRRQMRIRQIEVGSLMATCAAAVLAIAAAWAGAGYWALAIQLVMAEAFTLIYLVAITRWIPSGLLACRFGEARAALNFGGFLTAERLLNDIAHNMQVIVIGRIFTQVDAGLFYRSQTIAQMPQRRIVSPLSGAFIPSLSRLQEDPAAFRAMYIRQISRGNLIIVPIGLILCACADVLVRVLLGPDWTGTAPMLALMGVLTLSALGINSLTWALVACGRSKQLFFFRLISVPLLIVAMLIGASFGVVALVGAYVGTLVFVQGPLLAMLTLYFTPLTSGTFRQALLGEACFAGGALALLLVARRMLELTPAVEALVVLGLLAMLYLLRIALNAELRRDVARALRIRAR